VTARGFRLAGFYLPALLLLAVVVAYPIARTVALSFFQLNLATELKPEFAGWDNYARLASDSRFLNSLRVTGLFTAVSVAIEFALGLTLALAGHNWMRGQRLLRSIALAPWTLPTAITAVLWAWIFNDQYGVLNTILGAPIAWLARPGSAMAAVIIADVWKTTPFVFLVLLAGLQNIPPDLYEAIEIDGGGAWAKFRYVTWPFLLPYVFLSVIFRVIQAFAIFDLVWVMTGGGPGGSTETVSVYSYRSFMRYLDIGYGSAQVAAAVVILTIVALALYQVLLKRYARSF
jgi:multiple sugar transport system permease protein